MQEKIDELNYKYKRILRRKIVKHQNLHQKINYLQKIYFTLTGPFHILPRFFIIGAAKSGTTSLYDYLLQHPCIHSSLSKEPRYFDKYYHRGLSWYKAHYPTTLHRWFQIKTNGKPFEVVDATPRYLDHPHAPYRIKQIFPFAKFVILLRNPIDRAYSHWNMRSGKKKETLSFEEAIEQEPSRLEGEFEKMEKDENYYSSAYFHHAYLDRGIYVNKIKHWMSIFLEQQFLIIQSEKLFDNPQREYDKVLSFFDLPPWKLKDISPKGARTYSKHKMNPETRKKLSNYYSKHNEELSNFLNMDFEWD